MWLDFTRPSAGRYGGGAGMERGDLTWSENISYLCRCGVAYRAKRYRWVDNQHQRELRDRILADGPIEGICPNCKTPAQGHCSWVELAPREKKAVLILGEHQRGELSQELIAHLERVSRYEGSVDSWILRPDWRFEQQNARSTSTVASAVPMPLGNEAWPVTPSVTSPSESSRVKKNGFVTALAFEEAGACVKLQLGDEARRLLRSAALRVQPCLLRLSEGYPVLCVRIIASYLGQTAVIDAVTDPSSPSSVASFLRLEEEFKVKLDIRSDERPNDPGLCREVSAVGMARRLRFCVDSAKEALDQPDLGDHITLFERSKQELAATSSKERLAGAKSPLEAGSFQHLLMPEETRRALLELDKASHRENLRHLLEVDGLEVEEYEAIRLRVLASSLEQGLCAPSRFWPRVVKLGLAPDVTGYAQQLAENRQRIEQSQVDDLSAEHAAEARSAILDLCQKHRISLPPLLEAFLRGSSEGNSGSGAGGAALGGQQGGDFESGSGPGTSIVAAHETLDEIETAEHFFESKLLSPEEVDMADLAEAIDDDMDRLFPKHGTQASVEFMQDEPTEPVLVESAPQGKRRPPPPPPPLPPKE